MTSLPYSDKYIDSKWLPKDCDGLIKTGFTMIVNAFKAKVRAFEEELLTANKDRSEQEEKIAALQLRLNKLQREHLDNNVLQNRICELEEKLVEKTVEFNSAVAEYHKTEQDLLNDNRKLAEHLKTYKRKAAQLEAFRRIVLDTIKNEDDFEQSFFPDKLLPSHHGICTTTTGPFSSPISHHNTTENTNQYESQGRRLFRHARALLSVDQFELFLENVNKLNARDCTIEEAINESEKICGTEHSSIHEEFKELLLRKSNNQSITSSSLYMILASGQNNSSIINILNSPFHTIVVSRATQNRISVLS